MANALYDNGREEYLGGTADWNSNDMRLIFIDEADDTIDLVNDDFLDDRAAASRVAVSGSFAGKTITDGVADADDVTIVTVSGDQFESIDIYEHTGTDSTSSMIANIDTATGLPATPAGGDISVIWDAGSSRIFKL